MNDLSSSFKDITEEIKEYAWYKERPYSEADWKEFSKQMDDIDKEAKNYRWGMDPYVNLSKYLPMRDMDLTFMALSNDEFAKTQYMRYIRHLHSEIQAQGALR